MDPLALFEKRDRWFVISVGSILVLIVGTLDFLTGYDLAFSLFYVVPICLLTWFRGRWAGIVTSSASTIAWFAADRAAGHQYSNIFVPLWNTGIWFSFFLIISTLVTTLKNSVESERKLARVDYLTGVVNARFFYELLQKEMDRLQRHQRPLTLAYIDVDNMKDINARFGHIMGDQVLRAMATLLQQHTRSTDIVARIGGDEFALLLPELNDKLARLVFSRL
ncbi:MAG TPA: GGDEF domain-containing protein, partial [Syntrophorhabdaceae bacterium]|nr:GGDEF domain-containing protein [Syntrophorhabdaceae bacterium]